MTLVPHLRSYLWHWHIKKSIFSFETESFYQAPKDRVTIMNLLTISIMDSCHGLRDFHSRKSIDCFP
jgi:hypothetical protein